MARASKAPKGGSPRPDGELRQSQMITTYGPGAMVDLVADAVLIPGLEHWHYKGASGYGIEHGRLAHNLRKRGLKLSQSLPFRAPPVNAEGEPHRGCGIGAVEFPSWFVCPQRGCGELLHKRDTEHRGGRRVHRCAHSKKDSKLVPVRFVMACKNGHLDDFPWNYFVHKDPDSPKADYCSAPELRLVDSGSGDLSDVIVRCEGCGKMRSMAQARGEKALPSCKGKRPWLGTGVGDQNVREECNEDQRLLLRTASNGYFSLVESALAIPQVSNLEAEVREYFDMYEAKQLRKIDSKAKLELMRENLPCLSDDAPAWLQKLSDAELWGALQTYRTERDSDVDSGPVREAEYSTILAAGQEKPGSKFDSYGEQQDYYAERPAPGTCPLPEGISELVLCKRLREVRVLMGFTRLESKSQNIYGEFNLGSEMAAVSAASDWLPASEIRGEGVFIELDHERLAAWEQRDAVREREAMLKKGFLTRYPKAAEQGIQFLGARFYLLHTLSHLLITQLSLTCGYAASAIRERIYCSPRGVGSQVATKDPHVPMAGILLSTGSAGSEGTLGGLVEQGRRIDFHLTEALRRANLCSHDPVCARQKPSVGVPGRSLLGAACHGCLFIAECSCERANQYLDRGLVVPILGEPNAEELAFFEPVRG